MSYLNAYHRPQTIEDVLNFLNRPDIPTAILAGGSYLNAHRDETIQEVVDLQSLGLNQIDYHQHRLTLGAMTTLQAVVEDERTPLLLRKVLQREGPSTFREVATIGGVIVGADWESELLATLLACRAEVTVQSLKEFKTIPLADFLRNIPGRLENGLLTTVTFVIRGQMAIARVARTPADKPIVAAIGRIGADNKIHLALCGVAQYPILVEPDRLEHIFKPPADFRGSSQYRLQMAITLSKRVMAELNDKVAE